MINGFDPRLAAVQLTITRDRSLSGGYSLDLDPMPAGGVPKGLLDQLDPELLRMLPQGAHAVIYAPADQPSDKPYFAASTSIGGRAVLTTLIQFVAQDIFELSKGIEAFMENLTSCEDYARQVQTVTRFFLGLILKEEEVHLHPGMVPTQIMSPEVYKKYKVAIEEEKLVLLEESGAPCIIVRGVPSGHRFENYLMDCYAWQREHIHPEAERKAILAWLRIMTDSTLAGHPNRRRIIRKKREIIDLWEIEPHEIQPIKAAQA